MSIEASAAKGVIAAKISKGRDSLNAESSEGANDGAATAEKEPLFTWEDVMSDPCLFVPIFIMFAAGGVGFILFLVFWAFEGKKCCSDGAEVFNGLVLFAVGMLAAWEIRSLGSLADQIARLKVLRKHLEHSTNKLRNQVTGISGENAELQANVEAFRTKNDELRNTVNTFDEQNEQLRELQAKLEQESAQLKEETQAIRAQNEKLTGTVESMSVKHDELTEGLKAFDELRGHLNSMAEEQGEQMQDLISRTGDTFDKMDNLMKDNEQVLLHQIAADVELIDDEQGLSEREFKRFVARLPKRYKALVKNKGISFQTFDKDNSGVIEPSELIDLIDQMTAEVGKVEAKRRK